MTLLWAQTLKLYKMIVRNKEELEILKEAGKRLRTVLDEVERIIKPGVSTEELNNKALEVMNSLKVKPSFLGYTPGGHGREYPAALCTSLNEEVVHGIPNENPRILKEGDIITIDSGLWLEDICTDSARTVEVGQVDEGVKKLVSVAREARDAQINTARAGVSVAELGRAVENLIKKNGYFYPEILGGHGVGKKVHEEPFVPNYFDPYFKHKIKEGEVLALEPIVIKGTAKVLLQDDGYTYKSADGSWSAQFEHTVVVWKDGAEIIT